MTGTDAPEGALFYGRNRRRKEVVMDPDLRRMSLALDLMEEIRAPLCDRVALSLINRRQIKPAHLRWEQTGAVLLTEEGRKLVLTEWQTRKRAELRHPWLDERIPLGLVLQVQAQLLARHLRGDVSDYVGWLWS